MVDLTDELQTFRIAALPEDVPFSAAVRAGNTIYVSGQIGNRRGESRLVESGIEAEAQQALDHMREALEAAGSSLDRVVKCTVFLADMSDFQRFNAVYRSYFPGHLPARSGVEVQALALGARVEVECIALAR